MRLYEPYGKRGQARLSIGMPVEAAAPCNLLEEPVGDSLKIQDGTLKLEYTPFQIITLRVD